jgi:hypothetical protein
MKEPLHDSIRPLAAGTDSPLESAVKRFVFPRKSFSRQPENQKHIEKRGYTRFAVSIDVQALEPIANKTAVGRVTDLGFGGCFVESNDSFSPGTQVELHMQCGERVFRCRALVTHLAERGMGFTFTEADPQQEISVTDWVRELSTCIS